MFPKSINPASLLDGVFLKQLQNRFFEFPKIFGQLYRSILSNPLNQTENPPPKYMGAISSENPTIYSLLKEHPDYGKSPSTVLNASPNKSKTFTRIPTGSYVYLNPKTSEISWSMTPPPDDLLPKAQYNLKPMDPLSQRLDRAVKSYVGKPYEEIDCYELLVKGIKDMGFRYHGTGGIKDRLIRWAETTGKKSNTYLTGEGLVQATGNMHYSQTLKPAGNHKAQAEQIYEAMTPRLNKGHILSFSTRTRGHTGIISQKDGRWTFINSGDMDHNLSGKQRSMEVGEEDLKAEIENWLKRASRKNERLQISVGRLDGRKLAAYINPGTFIKRSA
ncbi:MAG: hypothetical protein H8E81_02660 [Deltaproteobacteria bacterium]|nr:hypothetical protein [Deltaproteobacteria bacterium]